jgi:hypothetical protein
MPTLASRGRCDPISIRTDACSSNAHCTMNRGLLHALMTAHAAQQSNGDEPIELVMPRVMRDMTTIFADARRVNTISERDLHSRIKANALAPPDERKEPFMSEAELIEAMQETRRATELYEQLLKSLDKLSVFKTRSALRQSARQAAKAAKHHCSHCKGKAVRAAARTALPLQGRVQVPAATLPALQWRQRQVQVRRGLRTR